MSVGDKVPIAGADVGPGIALLPAVASVDGGNADDDDEGTPNGCTDRCSRSPLV